MDLKNKHKTIGQKAQIIKRKVTASAMSFKPFHLLVKNRRAVNTVMSNLILIAAVIVVGFVVLAYVRSTANDYQTQYQQTVNSDIDKLKETLAFEYVHYDATGKVHIYFMNAGNVNVEIDKVFLSTSTDNFPFTMYDLNNNLQTSHVLGIGEERQIILQNITLVSGTYIVKLTTMRGLTFANNFAV